MFLDKSFPTIIYRHRKENLKKCSLKGLEKRKDLIFLTYPKDILPDLSSYICLKVGGKKLSVEDRDKGLFLIDATWNYTNIITTQVEKQKKLIYRSLPSFYRTAYPRKQTGCLFPKQGLASIEALFLSFFITQRKTQGLLDNYYWKETFLSINHIPLYLA